MRFKRLLALLLAAALALAVLVGCGSGQQSAARVLLNLLDGKYPNISVELDPDLEADLRQAISQAEAENAGDDAAAIRAALEKLVGSTVTFRNLGDGQQGDTTFDLVFYAGTDPDKAAQAAYSQWNIVFANVPDDGKYGTGLAMVQTDNGIWMLVKATVDKAGTEDKPDPVTLKSIEVTTNPKLEYWVGEPFDPTGMVITATYSNNTTKTLKDIEKNGDQGVKWTPDGALTTSDTSVTITYGGKTATVKVAVNVPTVKSLTVEPASLTYTAGATFDPEALGTITATYTNNKTENVLPTDCTFSIDGQGITPPYRFETVGDYTLTVTYKGGTDTVDITVNFGTVARITVSGPNKKEYELNETFNPDGLVVTASDGHGNVQTIPRDDYTLAITDPTDDPFELSGQFTTAGDYTLTVTYTEGTITKTDTITITVVDKGYTISADGTYYVSNENGLLEWNKAAQSDYTLNCTLTADITLPDVDEGESNWTPIGTESQPYTGTFDGGGHTITGLNISSPSGAVALFNNIGGAGKVMNLQLKDVTYNGSTAMGGIAHGNNGTITACSVTGRLTNTTNNGAVGGIAAINFGTITACWFNGTITGGSNVGGIAAFNLNAGSYSGKIAACYWSGGEISNGVGNGYDISGTTKVEGTTTWQTAVNGMNAALTGNAYQWTSGTDGLPTLTKN